ncbi:M20 aminoacylase family protein [Bradyrhizobium sp. NC92]|uniref:M20 aminoacylase family protein n=1 Tax=Bradyrhizobium sp. (strain NC92) TaxID=55395 RepID=UPI0021AAD152|nr:M20 aminoacylase family protein [Bradyrhizobium sp. NC92]UWU67978.1 M20 family metallopeptidase [Bradyrhizobium sp. NC92]
MAILNSVAALHSDIVTWRRDLHANPELGYDEHRTSAFVAERLREFGCDEVATGLGKTGVVGVIKGRKAPSDADIRVIGLRADMDALPIDEAVDRPYTSTTKGVMHACGHDGHTAMLLGAARYLAETRNFAGTAVMIFQPAEEAGAGAAAMISDGLMDRFGIEQVFAMHNSPGLPVGRFAIRQGPMSASTEGMVIKIEGHGGHASTPHKCINSVLVGAQLTTALQQIVASNIDPLEPAGVSVCVFLSGSSGSVVPQTAELRGTIRTLTPQANQLVKKRVHDIAAGIAQVTGATIDVTYRPGYPAMFNHAAQTDLAMMVAKEVVGEDNVLECRPSLGGEDFGYMLQERPGAYICCGNGDSAGLHHPAYDFNDDAILYGTSFWIKLVERSLVA